MTEEQLIWMAIGYLVLAGEIPLSDNHMQSLQMAIQKVREEGFKLEGMGIA